MGQPQVWNERGTQYLFTGDSPSITPVEHPSANDTFHSFQVRALLYNIRGAGIGTEEDKLANFKVINFLRGEAELPYAIIGIC